MHPQQKRPRKTGPAFVIPPGSPYTTPEQEYVESPEPGIAVRTLAVKWQACHRTLQRWSEGVARRTGLRTDIDGHGETWPQKRARFLAHIGRAREEAAAAAHSKAVIANAKEMAILRADAPKRHAQLSKAIQARIAKKLAQPDLSVSDISKLAVALRNAVEVDSVALGLREVDHFAGSSDRPSVRGSLLGAPHPDVSNPDDENAGDDIRAADVDAPNDANDTLDISTPDLVEGSDAGAVDTE